MLTWKAGGWGFPFGILLPLAVAGLIYYRRKIPLPVTLFVILYPISIILVFVSARYRAPLVPVLAVLAAAGAGALAKEFQSKIWRRQLVAGVICIGMVLLMTIPGPFAEEEINYEAELYFGVGCTQERMGRGREALANYTKAIELRPNYAEAHNNLGNALAKSGNHSRAFNHLAQAIKINPDYAEAHYNIGVALVGMERFGDALPYFQRAVEIMPDFADAHFNLGAVMIQTGKENEALKHLREAAELKPNSAEVHFGLGNLLARLGDLEGAIAEYHEALKIARPAGQSELTRQLERRIKVLQGARP